MRSIKLAVASICLAVAMAAAPYYSMANANGEADALAARKSTPAPRLVTGGDAGVRPFRVNVATADIAELRRRVTAARGPSQELVADGSQGVQLATLKELARYWATDYDWRKAERRLNSYPQFVTEIDGVDIHFIHVRSRHANALPMIVTHGGRDRSSSCSISSIRSLRSTSYELAPTVWRATTESTAPFPKDSVSS
jgi:hypothetical protein